MYAGWALTSLLSCAAAGLSALDAENEHLVQEALDRLAEGRTVLVIAHRLSTVKSADLVAVVDQGRIIECGEHKDLLSKPDGVYRKLMSKQSGFSGKEPLLLSRT